MRGERLEQGDLVDGNGRSAPAWDNNPCAARGGLGSRLVDDAGVQCHDTVFADAAHVTHASPGGQRLTDQIHAAELEIHGPHPPGRASPAPEHLHYEMLFPGTV